MTDPVDSPEDVRDAYRVVGCLFAYVFMMAVLGPATAHIVNWKLAWLNNLGWSPFVWIAIGTIGGATCGAVGATRLRWIAAGCIGSSAFVALSTLLLYASIRKSMWGGEMAIILMMASLPGVVFWLVIYHLTEPKEKHQHPTTNHFRPD